MFLKRRSIGDLEFVNGFEDDGYFKKIELDNHRFLICNELSSEIEDGGNIVVNAIVSLSATMFPPMK